ncbi:tetratricopeptide (TPR) repeat protein [Parabacteroides sp. PM5-20]|uniref:DUF3868 domain-containing protein n=1 Tax=Parabacteroides sp. PM5-20 TaxID=2940527 RepID=UPI0024739286|nr:DUF3868 domain-containing protein [Parabacteroides sp. PM5-20]MDH6534880.1 tetratricopeptide (TPR) repeat protein [Parabacteroides sp. PM5-20]
MKKKNIYILCALFYLLIPVSGWAQKTYSGTFGFTDLQIDKQGEKLVLQLNLDMSSVYLPSQTMVELTPVLRLEDETKSHYFPSVFVAGKTRNKVLQRAVALHSFTDEKEEQPFLRRLNKTKQSLPLSFSLPFEEWMRDAEWVLLEEVSGCANCALAGKEYVLVDRLLPSSFEPSYALQYVMPAAEPLKQRSETYDARLNYKVGKYDLLRDFGRNEQVLREVDQIVGEIRKDDNLTIQTLAITGYASPEGNYTSNMELSKNRAYSFVNYLVRNHNLRESMMKTDWRGEDWEGLRKNVLSSSLTDRHAVVRIIDENDDIAQRKQRLQSLNGGATYRLLLNEFYPILRRNEYTITYVARSFSIEEAKKIMKTKPQHLSLNEMFLVANTYPEGSPEFKEVFEIAVYLYPEDNVAKLNAAAQDIEAGNYDRAVERLKEIDLVEALNNMGVAYAKMGDNESAISLFKQAADRGNTVARTNAEQLEKARINK